MPEVLVTGGGSLDGLASTLMNTLRNGSIAPAGNAVEPETVVAVEA